MKKSFANVTLTVLAVLLLFAINAMALAPATMVYQGRLADADGNPITTEVTVNFALYAAPDAASVDSIWSETLPVTPDDQGVFTVELGTTVPLTTGIFNGGARFLGIKVGEDTQMTPFQLLASAPYAINSNIANGSIYNAHISNSAVISGSKISGTAATLSYAQRFTGTCMYGDSGVIANPYGMRIGDNITPTSSSLSLLQIGRNCNTSSIRYGLWSEIRNQGIGTLVGGYFYAYSSSATGGTKYGIYSTAGGTGTNYAGYFSGNVNVVGTLSKSAGSFKIDHPTDPTNKYLYHSFVESPDMMNVYNGNITTDADGNAIVELPDYFDALNKDFRYQLTVIGDFAQAIIGEEISDNQFTIRTDKPSVKVSWQVTGVRKDAFAEANRIQVEVEKPAIEKGLYLHPEAFKLGPEMQIHHDLIKNTQESAGDDNE